MSDLTPKEIEVLELLPATRKEIAEEIGISVSGCRYRMNNLKEKGYEFSLSDDNIWSLESDFESELRDEEEVSVKRVNTYNKAQRTKDIHNQLTELEKEVKETLRGIDPIASPNDLSSSQSTLFIPQSDTHVGAVIDDRYDVDYYSADEAIVSLRKYFDRAIDGARKRGDVENAVVLLNGDHVDGEGIYPGQRHSQEDNLRDQLKKASAGYIEQFIKLSEEFENVSIYCVPGNHGRLDHESTTNGDMILFDMIEIGLEHSPVNNVSMKKAGPGGFINFQIHGWNYHARHGDDYLNHVGTSSGQNRAKDSYIQYGFDVLLRSHYHSVKYETIGDEIPIVMTGSPAPPSTFAESKGASGGRCGVYWFVDDENRIDGFQPFRLKS